MALARMLIWILGRRFPQIADGGGGAAGGWRTTFILANRSTTAANANFGFYGNTGAPLSLAGGGMQQTQTTVVVPALGVAQVQTGTPRNTRLEIQLAGGLCLQRIRSPAEGHAPRCSDSV
jgi:hypothetical protein